MDKWWLRWLRILRWACRSSRQLFQLIQLYGNIYHMLRKFLSNLLIRIASSNKLTLLNLFFFFFLSPLYVPCFFFTIFCDWFQMKKTKRGHHRSPIKLQSMTFSSVYSFALPSFETTRKKNINIARKSINGVCRDGTRVNGAGEKKNDTCEKFVGRQKARICHCFVALKVFLLFLLFVRHPFAWRRWVTSCIYAL